MDIVQTVEMVKQTKYIFYKEVRKRLSYYKILKKNLKTF